MKKEQRQMTAEWNRNKYLIGKAVFFSISLALMSLFTTLAPLYGQQPLETETARPLKAGVSEVQTTFEYQTSSEGTERAAALGYEYGITDRLSFLAEPVFYTSIDPKAGAEAKGLGDFEATLSYLFGHERHRLPALAAAVEVKAPTARNLLIGTGKTDFASYVFGSKRFGNLDMHTNVGYTFVGKPAGAAQADNINNVAFAGEYFLGKRNEILAEILANTTSGSGEGVTSNSSNQSSSSEVTGGELIGMIGFRHHFRPEVAFAFGMNYDNNGAILIRMGFTFNMNSQKRKGPENWK